MAEVPDPTGIAMVKQSMISGFVGAPEMSSYNCLSIKSIYYMASTTPFGVSDDSTHSSETPGVNSRLGCLPVGRGTRDRHELTAWLGA